MAERELKDLKPGDRCVMVRARSVGGAGRRLFDMGVVPGAEIRIIRVAPLGDPIEINVRGFNLTLRREEAMGVIVEVE